jgi:NADH-quinone oxidoreductase subunit M
MGLLSVAIWLPVLAGGLLLAAGRDEHAAAVRWFALIAALAGFLVTIPLATGFDVSTAAMQFSENLAWIDRFNIRYHLGVDGISVWWGPSSSSRV